MDTCFLLTDTLLKIFKPQIVLGQANVGKRKVIEFFLSPLMKKQSESLREL